MDPESAQWIADLSSAGSAREAALIRLRDRLVRACGAELSRRPASSSITGPELRDLADQAANDAMVAVLAKLGTFRGESRFTTWAYRFAMLEVSNKLGRHYWLRPHGRLDDEQWQSLPDRFGVRPDQHAEAQDLADALRRAVDESLTDHQRQLFVAVVVNGIPLDAVVADLGGSRNSVYKVIFDARRKIRAALVAKGYVEDVHPEIAARPSPARGPDTGAASRTVGELDAGAMTSPWDRLAAFLATDPADVGCDRAIEVLHEYAEIAAAGEDPAARFPGVVAHLAACGPCGEDYQGLVDRITAPDRHDSEQ